jgi:hypothetical protein
MKSRSYYEKALRKGGPQREAAAESGNRNEKMPNREGRCLPREAEAIHMKKEGHASSKGNLEDRRIHSKWKLGRGVATYLLLNISIQAAGKYTNYPERSQPATPNPSYWYYLPLSRKQTLNSTRLLDHSVKTYYDTKSAGSEIQESAISEGLRV